MEKEIVHQSIVSNGESVSSFTVYNNGHITTKITTVESESGEGFTTFAAKKINIVNSKNAN